MAKLTQALKTTEGSWTRHQELSPILHHIVQPWTATMYDSKETILKEKLNKLESFIALQPQRPRLKTSERKWRSKKAVCADTGLFCKLPFSKFGMVSAFRVIFFLRVILFCAYFQKMDQNQDIAKLKGLGCLGVANFCRIWLSQSGYPTHLSEQWCSTGPGTRAGINLLNKYPSVPRPR